MFTFIVGCILRTYFNIHSELFGKGHSQSQRQLHEAADTTFSSDLSTCASTYMRIYAALKLRAEKVTAVGKDWNNPLAIAEVCKIADTAANEDSIAEHGAVGGGDAEVYAAIAKKSGRQEFNAGISHILPLLGNFFE